MISRDRAAVCFAIYLIGFGPTLMVADGGVAEVNTPKPPCMEMPARCGDVLVQPEMEKQRSPLVLIPPFFVAGTSEASESIDPAD